MANDERQLAIETQAKFEFYFVALVFTILGLAIQTAPPSGPLVGRAFELLGWLCLLVSGLAGLSRLEWTPVLRVALANKDEASQKLSAFKEAARAGQTVVEIRATNEKVPIEERISKYESLLPDLDRRIKALESQAGIKYSALKMGFVAGVVFLLMARGWPIVLDLAAAVGI